MKRLLLVSICVLLVAAGCKEREDQGVSPAGPAEKYFPLAKGNRWVWIAGLIPAKGDTIIWEVKDKLVREDGKLAWKIWNKRYWQDKNKSIIDSMNYRSEPSVLLMYMDHFDPDADTVLNYPLSDGKRWTVAHILAKGVVRTAQVAGREDVVTPYGRFENALRIDSQDRRVPDDSLMMKTSDWYVPDVGRVMTRVEARGQVWEMRLLSMELH